MNSALWLETGGSSTSGAMMIDYITARIGLPRPLPEPIHGGYLVRTGENGDVEVSTARRKTVLGSHEASLQIRAPSTNELEISGNPAKFVQGHNLWGPSDPIAVLWDALKRVEREKIIPPLASLGIDRKEALAAFTTVSRVDCTVMFLGKSLGDVLYTLRSLRVAGRLRDRGKSGLPYPWARGDGVTFGSKPGKSFTHRSITFYSKGLDVRVHPLPELMQTDRELLQWAERCLRCEVRLGRNYLRKTGLQHLAAWSEETANDQWTMMMERMDMNGSDVKPQDLDSLPPRLQMAYAAWQKGMDLKTIHSKPTFYRYRSALLDALGVDIAIPRSQEPTAHIVPIKRVIELEPAGRPEFADRIEAMLDDAA